MAGRDCSVHMVSACVLPCCRLTVRKLYVLCGKRQSSPQPCFLFLQGKTAPNDPVVARFKDCIEDFKQIMPMLEELANPALKRRHW